jgi:2-polyprenyl-3-methyl-5-hydroxy-6-metoxy-1,4-benzoquinol methylase
MDDMPGVNVADIMEQIRENIRKQEETSGLATIQQSSNGLVAADLAALQNHQDICRIHFTSHRKFLGPLIILAKKFVRQLLTPSLERQSEYNAVNNQLTRHLCQEAEALQKRAREFSEQLHGARQQLAREFSEQLHGARQELAEQIGGVHQEQVAGLQALRRELVEGLGGVHQRQVAGLQELRREVAAQLEGVQQAHGTALQALRGELSAQLGGVQQAHGTALQALRGELSAQLGGVQQAQGTALQELRAQLIEQIAMVRHDHTMVLQGLRERSSRTERQVRRILYFWPEGQTTNGQEEEPSALAGDKLVHRKPEPSFDYFGFEERFRGSAEDIKERQRVYVEYFKDSDQVLDIGCGRGEFLELLAEMGIRASGVDFDLDMVLYCQEKGLDVVNADAFAYLSSIPDASLGGIFAAQVIEHLEANRIIELVQLSQRKLRPGGALILETPNPTCLAVFARSFYMDFSHVKPIHPEAVRFLFESAGFNKIEVHFSASVEACMRIPPLPVVAADAEGVADFNKAIERLNDLLYGFQDYAVIGRKSSH